SLPYYRLSLMDAIGGCLPCDSVVKTNWFRRNIHSGARVVAAGIEINEVDQKIAVGVTQTGAAEAVADFVQVVQPHDAVAIGIARTVAACVPKVVPHVVEIDEIDIAIEIRVAIGRDEAPGLDAVGNVISRIVYIAINDRALRIVRVPTAVVRE